MIKQDTNMEKTVKSTIKQFEDPVRMMLLIKILRKPDITSNELKKSLLIPGTKIYYYLNQLSSSKPPLIYESDKEKVTEHLTKRKFRTTEQMENMLRTHFHPSKNPKGFQLYHLYTSIALQYQRLREIKAAVNTDKLDRDPTSLLMFVDDEIAEELREGILEIFNKCSNKYRDFEMLDAIRQLNFTAFAGIYPMN